MYELVKRQEATKRKANQGGMEEVFGWRGWIAKTLRGLQDRMAEAHNRVAIAQNKKSMWKCIHITVIVFKKNGSDEQGQHPLEEYNT